jgi:hypothetical protein
MRPIVYQIWFGVTVILLIVAGYLQSQMLKHRIPRQGLLHPWWWRRGFTMITDPANYTETGQFYRRWTIRLELASMIWMFMVVVIFAATPRG